MVPMNCEEVVGDLLNAVGLSGEETIQIGEDSLVLKNALMHRLACTVLSKIQIKKFNEIAQTEQLTDLLQIANKDALVDYMWGRELIDLFFWNFRKLVSVHRILSIYSARCRPDFTRLHPVLLLTPRKFI